MVSLFFRNLLFTILHPGIVAGLIPYFIVRHFPKDVFSHSINTFQYIGIPIFIIGFLILIICIIDFAVSGLGTLSPIDPTKKLVVKRFYSFSRNPMYVGVMLILIGESLFFKSFQIWLYSFLVFIIFNLFIIYVEEPRLKKDFKDQYKHYCKRVRRWI